jgi:hypothetical protein
MWYSLTHNWNVARFLRLLLGGITVYQGILTNQNAVILMGGFFAAFSLFTSGCCGSTCVPKINKDIKPNTKEIDVDYEEVK